MPNVKELRDLLGVMDAVNGVGRSDLDYMDTLIRQIDSGVAPPGAQVLRDMLQEERDKLQEGLNGLSQEAEAEEEPSNPSRLGLLMEGDD